MTIGCSRVLTECKYDSFQSFDQTKLRCASSNAMAEAVKEILEPNIDERRVVTRTEIVSVFICA